MGSLTDSQFVWLAVAVFFVATVLFVYVTLGVGALIRPKQPSREKARIYECGEPTIGTAWVRYNIRFYTVALVFLIFDVEAVFLFPVARVFRYFAEHAYGWVAAAELLGFVAVLLVALIYAWRFGNLDWLRGSETADTTSPLDQERWGSDPASRPQPEEAA
jgi:NADH-quinone oxidoreductase subunit A